ncbi:MAG TPA: hypothetical protein VGR76_07975 [Candidatus Angelobacter sp.]|nr:hypothetical protein [Candidatus Angelobacter sp.]
MFHAIPPGIYLYDFGPVSGGKDAWACGMVVFNQFKRLIWAGTESKNLTTD